MTAPTRTDARFLLPRLPTHVWPLPSADGWLPLLEPAGLTLAPPHGPVEVVVAGHRDVAGALERGPDAILFEGRRPLRVEGFATRRFLSIPSVDAPSLLVPADRPNVLRYTLARWASPARANPLKSTLVRALRGTLARIAPYPTVTTAVREPGQPHAVREASDVLGLAPDLDWLLICGNAHLLSRNVFVLFERGADRPTSVLKLGRRTDVRRPFDAEERAQHHVRRLGPVVSGRVPQHVGRVWVRGHAGAVETAAPGRPANELLRVVGRNEGARTIEAVAAWILELGARSLGPPGSAASEVRRLQSEAHALGVALDPTVFDRLVHLPAVLQHCDLGSYNVLARGSEQFSVVDWERFRPTGLPVADLWFFLYHALLHLDDLVVDRAGALRLLFAGGAPSSDLVHRYSGRAARLFGIDDHLLGDLATLTWLQAMADKAAHQQELDGGERAPHPDLHALLTTWLTEPRLGSRWRPRAA